jgi:hypothetical protein
MAQLDGRAKTDTPIGASRVARFVRAAGTYSPEAFCLRRRHRFAGGDPLFYLYLRRFWLQSNN